MLIFAITLKLELSAFEAAQLVNQQHPHIDVDACEREYRLLKDLSICFTTPVPSFQ